MKPLDNLQVWLDKIDDSDVRNVLSEEEARRWNAFSPAERRSYLEKLLTKPIVFENPEVIGSWYYRSKWAAALKAVHDAESISVFEVGAGCTDMLPQTMAYYYNNPATRYLTANMNKELTGWFKQKTQRLPIQVDVIEDAAQNISEYSEKTGLFDVVVFEHSVNDVIETMLAERADVDTVHSGWMDILPKMIELVNAEYENQTLEESVKRELLDLLASCMEVLKPGGFIIINHYEFQYNLDNGINPDWWENMLPIVRGWISDAGLGEEIFFPGFEPHWWMFLKKAD